MESRPIRNIHVPNAREAIIRRLNSKKWRVGTLASEYHAATGLSKTPIFDWLSGRQATINSGALDHLLKILGMDYTTDCPPPCAIEQPQSATNTMEGKPPWVSEKTASIPKHASKKTRS